MFKCLYFLFIFLSFIPNIFSQEINIPTKFSNNGSLHEDLSENAQTLTEFKENDECIVVDYLGKDIYKVSYKKLVGFVKAGYLFVNDDMIELVIAYEDKIRIEAIEKEKKRKKEVEELIRKSEEEKQRQEALEFKEAEEFKNKVQDSITKALQYEKQKQEDVLELKRKAEEELNRKREDSIASVRLNEKQKLEALELKRKLEELNRRREDSIIKVRANEKQQQAVLELKSKREELNKKKKDSVLKIDQNKGIVNKISENNKYSNTCDYAINEFDRFYGIRTVRTNPYQLNKSLTVELYKQAQKTNVFFNLSEDLGCASYLPNMRSNVKVTLENDDMITFYHFWDIDCGNFSLKGNLSSSDMERLKKSPIKSIVLKGTESSRDITEIDYKEFFIDKLKCIE